MAAVLCQAQTEAVFISHADTDPLARWDAGLVAWLTAVYRPVTTCLSDCSAYLSASYSPACSFLPTCLAVSNWQPLCQTTRLGVSVLPLWTTPVQLHFFFYPLCLFFFCQSSCSSCRAVSLSSSLVVFCHFVCLSGFPAEGCLDRCRITRTPQTYHSHTRTKAGREDERKRGRRRRLWWMKGEINGKKRRRGKGREHIQ